MRPTFLILVALCASVEPNPMDLSIIKYPRVSITFSLSPGNSGSSCMTQPGCIENVPCSGVGDTCSPDENGSWVECFWPNNQINCGVPACICAPEVVRRKGFRG